MNWKITIRGILFLGIFALFACSRRDEDTVAEPVQQSIVATNFSIGSFVNQITDDESVTIFDIMPVGADPEKWQPDAETIQNIEKTESLVFIAGKEPAWVKSLSNKIDVINVFPVLDQPFEAAYKPSQAITIYRKIQAEITSNFDGIRVKPSSSDFYSQLRSYQKKWAQLGKLEKQPKHLRNGATRPAKKLTFLNVLEKNYQQFQSAKNAVAVEEVHIPIFEGKIIPILERTCMECHDEISEEGDLNFEPFLTEKAAEQQPDLWEKVAKVIELGQMPPSDNENQLTEKDKINLAEWASAVTNKWDSGEMGTDPGRTTVHRLNKNEYNYTVRDLFGLKIRPADNFPEQGTGEGGFDNNADALFLPPLLMENYFESVSTIVQAVYSNSQTRSRYLRYKPQAKVTPVQAAEQTLKYWATFIFRKPANDEEIKRLVDLFKKEFEAKKKFDEAMKQPLFSMLLSPNFLYRSTLSEIKKGPYLIDHFELASKLSYFLWSSMPDKQLFKLASEGKLNDPVVIEQQVKRMLLDEKSRTLGMHFGGQWFGWEELRSSANPDVKKYPQFTFPLRVALYQESMQFFNHLVKENESAYQLLDSDYTFLNERLAKFYKIPGVTGNEFRLVNLTDENRGGVLGMGSVLTATSLPLRSSPSIRGSFVVKDVLGITLPEPPMNIPQLPEDDRTIVGATLRDTLKQHREDPNCYSCHNLIDPLGFGLDAFDAIGRLRTHQNGVPLDTTGVMPDGTQFSTPAELKNALLKEKDLFTKNMVKKMLSYALGRDLTPFDRPEIKKITDKVIADNGRIQTAFIEVAKSYPFRYRRSSDNNPIKAADTKHKEATEDETNPNESRRARRRKRRLQNQ